MKEDTEHKFIADPFASKNLDDLFEIIDSYHADTPEAAQKRKNDEEQIGINIKYLNTIDDVYFKKKHGETVAGSGIAAKYSLPGEGQEVRAEATKLLNAHIITLIKKDMSPAAAEEYLKKPENIKVFARGKGLKYDEILDDMIENSDNVQNSKQYGEMKNYIAQMMVGGDLEYSQKAQSEIISNHNHHEGLRKRLNLLLKDFGKVVDPNLRIDKALGHYRSALEKKINEDYFIDKGRVNHFKAYEGK